ncbi:MAG: uncharacterized protein QOC56_375 [Alphaproteobacteria bacterium]|nr:uncharacterized protein [Alphaproteobacteria bacterium]
MTPEERNLINELFDRLAALEDAERDPEAERAIKDGLRRAPNAPYALVQTVLVQDEALKRAQQRIDELEARGAAASEPSRPTSFLDRARDGVWGRRDAPRAGSVPSVPPVRPPDAAMGAPAGYGYGAGAQPIGGGAGPAPQGGSFLGTAAAAAAGVIGGSLLMSGLRSMTGQAHAGHGLINPGSAASGNPATPWGDASGGKLAHDAGLDDIGRSPSGGSGTENSGEAQRQGLFDDSADPAGEDNDQDENEADFDDGGGDDGGDGDGP